MAEFNGLTLGVSLDSARAVVTGLNPGLQFSSIEVKGQTKGFRAIETRGGVRLDDFAVIVDSKNRVVAFTRSVRRFPLQRISHSELTDTLILSKSWPSERLKLNQNTTWTRFGNGKVYTGPIDGGPCAAYAPTGDPADLVPIDPAIKESGDCGQFMMVSLPGPSTDTKVASYAYRAIDGKTVFEENLRSLIPSK